MRTDPPYRIVTDRLAIRCWEPSDAPLLREAVDASLEHLRPWMPWAVGEPRTLDETRATLEAFSVAFRAGDDFTYGIFVRDETQVVGGTGLHTRVGSDAFEIGYWIRADRVREGLATETTAALTRIGLELCGAEWIEIRVDPANEHSAGVPRNLGFHEDATLRRRLPPFGTQRGFRDVTIYSLFHDELAASPAVGARVEAYDADGTRVL